MTSLVARLSLLFMLPLFVLSALALIVAQALPYAGEIRYILYANMGLTAPYTIDAQRGIALQMFPMQTVLSMDWSPDHQYIVTNVPDGTYIMAVDDGSTRQLYHYRITPIWSPDSTRLAFEGFDDYVDDELSIYIANADGTDVTQLLSGETGDFRQPSFSPDGTQLAYVHDNDLYIYHFADERVVRLTETPAIMELQPNWSPDSQHVAFFWYETPQLSRLSVIDADGKNRTDLSASLEFGVYNAFWSPDSTQVSFLMQGIADGQVFITSLDNPTPRQIGEPYPQILVNITGWSARGDELYLIWVRQDMSNQVFIYNDTLDTATGELLRREETEGNFPLISPDGEFIAYFSGALLCVENRATDEQRCYPTGDGVPLNPRWLP